MPTWTTENEYRLLLTIIKLLNISQLPKWDEVSREMNNQGLPFTSEGCRQHFQKIRKSSTTVATPRKSGTSAARPSGVSKKTATPSKRKLGQIDQDDDLDDDEIIIMTPSKSSRTKSVDLTPKMPKRDIKPERDVQTAHIFKAEAPGEDGAIYIDDNESIYDRE